MKRKFVSRSLILTTASLLAVAGLYSAAKLVIAAPPAPAKLVMTTWAATGFLKNPTALTFDRDGRCYVAQDQRREGGEMTSRDTPQNLIIPDHTFVTVEDRARFGGKGDASWGDQTGGKMETISLLEDTRHTGTADKASVYYEGWNRNINDILCGVMWYEGNIYATVAPDLWLLKDTKGVGQADEIKSISHGYAVHMGYPGHNMHGLTMGPDGKVYCTMGDKGINLETPGGGRLDYHNTGTVVRMNPDGSDPEVFCYGVRNLYEIAFDKYGNLFAVDNDGDYPTERERFVYLTEESDSGWRFHWQFRSAKFDVAKPAAERKLRYNVWMDEKMFTPYHEGQAAYILPPLSNYSDGPAGFKYASEACLDPGHVGYFFLAQFPKAVITSFAAKPKGAGFTMADEHTIVRGTQCIGLTFGLDGALYGAEWGNGGYKLKHTGSVVKFDDPASAQSPLRKETAALLHDGPAKKSNAELARLLGHGDMRVRQDAQFELARRKAGDVFMEVAFATGGAGPTDAAQMSRIHAMWGIGQLVKQHVTDKRAAMAIVKTLASQTLADPDAEIRAQGVKLLGEIVRAESAGDPSVMGGTDGVMKLITDPSARVRSFAATALGNYHDSKSVPALLKLAAENKPMDPYIRQSVVMGLVGSGDAPALVNAASNSSQQVKLAAIVALRRMKHAGVANFLADKDETIVTEAARAIHDDESIPEVLQALAKLIDRPNLTSQALIRRVLNANLRLGGAEQIAALVRYAGAEHNPAALRIEVLDMLATWENPAVNDRVEGIYRVWPKRNAAAVTAIIEPQLATLLAAKDANVGRAATQLIDQLKIRTDDNVFVSWVTDATKPAPSRVTALRLLASRKYPKLDARVNTALASKEPSLRSEALRVLAASDPARCANEIAKVLAGASLPEKQAAYTILPELKSPQAEPMLLASLDQLLAGKLDPNVQLDVLEAAAKLKSAAIKDRLTKYDASLPKTDALAKFLPCLTGGDSERGREIFNGQAESSCIRCHTTGDSGSNVGPNLAGIGSDPLKPRRYLLESMIDPNAVVVPGFGIGAFTMKDGSQISGFVKSETADAVQVLDLEGNPSAIKKSDIASRTPVVSMMPAMGAILSKTEIRDVLEYVATLKK